MTEMTDSARPTGGVPVMASAAGQVGARTGHRLMLTRGPNRLIGRVSSDSVTWITLRLDTGCSLAVDLHGWTVEFEPGDRRRPWVRRLHRWFAWLESPLGAPLPWEKP